MAYLDYNATAPLRPEALEAMRAAFFTDFANPASVHDAGMRASYLVEKARASIAESLGCKPEELFFTSGGTEANWLALSGLAEIARERGRPLAVTSAIEHHCVLATLEKLAGKVLFSLRHVPAQAHGCVDIARFGAALTGRTGVAALMLANNETGAIQPVGEVAAIARERGVLLHCDAVQAAGKIHVNLHALGVDTAAFSAHKFGGPKGIGALYVRGGLAQGHEAAGGRQTPGDASGALHVNARMFGGPQEGGLRPGTHNTPGIAGMAAAIALAVKDMPAETARLAALRNKLRDGILAAVPGSEVNALARVTEAPATARGSSSPHSITPNTLSIWLPGHAATGMVRELSARGVYASAGAACSASNVLEPSHVLLGMGLDAARATQSLRFSLGHETAEADIDAAIRAVAEIVRVK